MFNFKEEKRLRETMEYSYEEMKNSTNDFSLDCLIGKGSHGSVYKATFNKKEEAAVKKPSEGLLQSLNDAAKLDNEIEILSSVMENPYLVNLVGICRGGPKHKGKLLVTEFMPNGSLHDLLHSAPTPPSWPRRMLIALRVACAIRALHEADPCIVHRDIKSANVLFDRRWNARLADFSLAVRAHGSAVPVPAAGTLGYLDPGYTAADKLSPKNDVFSFGVLLLELVSARKVMDMDCEPASIVSWAVPLIREEREADVCDGRVGLRGEMTVRLVRRMLGVAARCVLRREERRPTMAEVVGELRAVAECVSWPSWGCLKGKISRRVHLCSRAWRRCKKKRVTTTTTITKIVCKVHLIDDEDEEDV